MSTVHNLYTKLLNVFLKEKNLVLRYYSYKKPYKLLFFGSDNISFRSFRKVNELKKNEDIIERLDLVTSNTSKIKTHIEDYAHNENIQVKKWPLDNFQPAEYDLGLIVAFGHLIKADLLNKFPLGMVNIHPSLLPRWRGAAPIIHTLLNGDQVTGVTLMKIKADIFDVGEIISQRKVPVSKDILLPELTEQLSDIGADMLVDCLRELPNSIDNAYPQSHEGITYARKINKSISDVRWEEMTATDVYNLYRAIHGMYVLSTKFKDKKMKLLHPFLCDNNETNRTSPVGCIEYCTKTKSVRVLCKDRKYIYFKSIRIVGKREITAVDFYNGYIKNVPVEKRNTIIVGS